jgi:hypothetical protein
MRDINGSEFRKGGCALLLCEVLDVEDAGVRVRIMNSEMELFIGCKCDEVLGGMVADSELTAFDEPQDERDDQADGVKIGAAE